MQFLTALPITKALGIAALTVILSLSIALFAADRLADKWEAQAQKLSRALKRISEGKNLQRTETGRNITEAEKGRKGAETIAQRIENAPLTGQCKTPDAVMGADL